MNILESLRGNPLIGSSIDKFIENPHDEAVKNELFKSFKKFAPLAAWDRIPLKYGTDGQAVNADVATEAAGLSKAFTNDLRPDLGEKVYIVPTSNGSSKSYSLHWLAASLLTDSHPTVKTKGEPGDILILTNSHLIKTEWPKVMMDNPGWLGNRKELESDQGCPVVTSSGETHRIKVIKSEGAVVGFQNLTTGRCMRFHSYKENYQKTAGLNPHSILIDEFGDQTKGSGDSHTLTKDRFAELFQRCGRNTAQKNGIMVMCFTLIFEDWVYEVIDKAKEKKFLRLNKDTGEQECYVKIIDQYTSKDNPYLNRKQQEQVEDFYTVLGWTDILEKRLYGKSTEDPVMVFPRWRRPIPILLERREDENGIIIPGRNQIIEKIKNKEPGWKWIEAMDPGLGDKCSVLIAAAHPVEGLYVLDGISGKGLEVKAVINLLKEKEKALGIDHNPSYWLGRYFDKFSYGKRTQENPTPAFETWQQNGLFASPSISNDRSYNDLFALIGRNLVYYWDGLTDLDKEIRKHKKDPVTGVPNAKGGDDNIDSLRYLADVYYRQYYNTYHTSEAENSDVPEWITKRRLVEQAMLERYNAIRREDPQIQGLSAGFDSRYM